MLFFDIVFEIDMQEVCNVVENVICDLVNCWDFCNVLVSFELNEKNESIKVVSEFDFQVE